MDCCSSVPNQDSYRRTNTRSIWPRVLTVAPTSSSAKRQAVQGSEMVYFRVQVRTVQMQANSTRLHATKLSASKPRSCICQMRKPPRRKAFTVSKVIQACDRCSLGPSRVGKRCSVGRWRNCGSSHRSEDHHGDARREPMKKLEPRLIPLKVRHRRFGALTMGTIEGFFSARGV
jgi:hypothetical protein